MNPAEQAAQQACREWGLPAPQLVRTGMSSLHVAGDVVVRVVHDTGSAAQVLWLAEALAERGVRVARHVRAPLAIDGFEVFGLQRLTECGPIDWRTVGTMVRRVHDWPVAEVVPHHSLPHAGEFAWWQADTLMAEVDDLLDDEARRGLRAAIDEHGGWRERGADALVCHGDVHPGDRKSVV